MKIEVILGNNEHLTLVSDGWTNIRKENLVNIVVKAPNHSPIFYKSINTSGNPQTVAAVSSAIEEVIIEIGARKFDAVITDNANVMQDVWKILEVQFPRIQAYSGAATICFTAKESCCHILSVSD
jgi:hypothetical protein